MYFSNPRFERDLVNTLLDISEEEIQPNINQQKFISSFQVGSYRPLNINLNRYVRPIRQYNYPNYQLFQTIQNFSPKIPRKTLRVATQTIGNLKTLNGSYSKILDSQNQFCLLKTKLVTDIVFDKPSKFTGNRSLSKTKYDSNPNIMNQTLKQFTQKSPMQKQLKRKLLLSQARRRNNNTISQLEMQNNSWVHFSGEQMKFAMDTRNLQVLSKSQDYLGLSRDKTQKLSQTQAQKFKIKTNYQNNSNTALYYQK